ncbi:hypothetical protein [Neobacillus drentensis]|nr:hypothetical protein [Neobacillus drentensis]
MLTNRKIEKEVLQKEITIKTIMQIGMRPKMVHPFCVLLYKE